MDDELFDRFIGQGRHRRMPRSSVTWQGELPGEDAPSWACLAKPGAPVVVRRYDARSRTCDALSSRGRWLLESAMVPRRPIRPAEFQVGWDLAVGDVQPGWCIVYAGHRLWFPQRVLRVDVVSDDWQRVWTLGDIDRRDVWQDDLEYAWDNGLATGWKLEEMRQPHWKEPGPWWPLQSEPLSEEVRRFTLAKFYIPGECPQCNEFGKPIFYGFPSGPLGPHVITGGCGITGDDPDYGCACGEEWSVSEQGRVRYPSGPFSRHNRDFDPGTDPDWPWHWETGSSGDSSKRKGSKEPQSEAPEAALNYDLDDPHPYGKEATRFFMAACQALRPEAGAEQVDDDPLDRPDSDEWDIFTEVLVGPEGSEIFALHHIEARRRLGEIPWQVVDHEWRADGNWSDMFPGDTDDWRWEAETERLAAIPDVVQQIQAERGRVDERTLAWDVCSDHPMQERYVPAFTALFDLPVRIPAALAHWMCADPDEICDPTTLRATQDPRVDAAMLTLAKAQSPSPVEGTSASLETLRRFLVAGIPHPAHEITCAIMDVLERQDTRAAD